MHADAYYSLGIPRVAVCGCSTNQPRFHRPFVRSLPVIVLAFSSLAFVADRIAKRPGAGDRLMEHSAAACLLPLLFTALFLLSSCRFGSGIPTRYDGFYYSGGGENWKDAIVVDAFLDPLCPDSRDAWPPLKQVVRLYSPHLAVIVHPFPLP
ncbi:hypothetical protein GW17_00014494 [Ensete ventricosum]|nr:hypothetical protein GW17_00014494 [Ensete ventricosum]